jgi:hypothetical protein
MPSACRLSQTLGLFLVTSHHQTEDQMPDQNKPEMDQTRLALAALAASIVSALGEHLPTFRQAFDKELEKRYYALRDADVIHVGAMETLKWTRDFLREP